MEWGDIRASIQRGARRGGERCRSRGKGTFARGRRRIFGFGKKGAEVSASHLGCQRGPGGERWSGWSARSHGYRPPRDTRPRRSTCEADGARSPSARFWSGGSARCTSTAPLQRHTSRHTTLSPVPQPNPFLIIIRLVLWVFL